MVTTSQHIRILVAGSSQHSLWCLQALMSNPEFDIVGVITPSPKPQGRSQKLAPNPLHEFATEQDISTILVEQSLNTIQSKVTTLVRNELDFLLVVDFGYLIPEWLLELPRVAPLNIHPSRLPAWRGSSPGQFVLLSGATKSAISLIKMDNQLDHGPLIAQLEFAVDPTWNAHDYYQAAFHTITPHLSRLIQDLITHPTRITPQPDDSPTPLARKLKRQDGFIPFTCIYALQNGDTSLSAHTLIFQLSELHQTMFAIFWHNQSISSQELSSLGNYLNHVARAFSPWPSLWTDIPTKKGAVKMSILSCSWNSTAHTLELQHVHVAGQQPALWNQVKTMLITPPSSPLT